MDRYTLTPLLIALVAILFTASVFAAEPSSQPPAVQPAAQNGPARVVILPFTPSGPDSQPWISDALQRALLSDLSRLNTVLPISLDKANDDIVHQSGARYVITGSYQLVGNDLRFVGQVKEVATDQPIAGLKATGSLRDLFALEDQISTQANRALAKATGAAVATTEQAPATIEPNGPLAMRTYDYSSLKDSVNNPDSSLRNQYIYNTTGFSPYYYGGPYYGYDYADYGYYPQPYLYSNYYPYWGSGFGFGSTIIIVNNKHFHDGHDGHFHDGHDGHFGHDGNINGEPVPLRNNPSSFVSAPRRFVTPQTPTPGFGNQNGFMPMTMNGSAVPRNFNLGTPMTVQTSGTARNFNGGGAMTMRGR